MQDTLVVEQDHVTFLPVMRIDVLRGDSRALELVHDIANLLEVIDDGAVLEMDLADRTGVDLKSQVASNGVLPAHRQNLDLGLLEGRELLILQLKAVGDHTQTGGARARRRHPDVRVGSVFDLGGADKFLVFVGKNVVHVLAGNESCGAERNVHCLIAAIVVKKSLATALRDADSHQ